MEKVVVELEAKTDKAEAGLNDVVDAIKSLNKAVVDSNSKTEKSLKDVENQSKKSTNIVKKLAKGFTGVGLAMKAAGFALIIKTVNALGSAMTSNQKVVDLMSSAFETISIILSQVSDVFISMFEKVSDLTGGFDALQKVIGGSLSIAINIVVGAIQGIVLGVQKAQLAWEKSFLGDGDPKEIKRLNEAIAETQEKLIETGNRISNSGKQIANNFLEAVGEVGSLAQGVSEAVSESIEKIDVKQAISDGKRIANAKKNFELLALQQQRLVEKYDLQAEQQRQIRDDESKSINERILANQKLGEILLKQNEAEKQTVQSRIDALKEEERLKGKSIELTNQIFELETEMIAIDAKVAGFKSEQLTNINSLKREQLDLENENEEIRLEELQERADREIEIEQSIADRKKQINLDYINFAASLSGLLQQIAGKNKAIAMAGLILEKGAAIANVVVKAKESIATATANEAKVPFFTSLGAFTIPNPLKAPSLATTAKSIAMTKIGAGLAIAGITATAIGQGKSISGGGGGQISTPTPSVPTGASTPPSFNVVGQSDTNQLAAAIGGQSQQPVQAYVVANDVTTAQSMDRNIIDDASLGD
jgi:hypothetical protein